MKDNVQTQLPVKLTEKSNNRLAFAQVETNPKGAEIFVDAFGQDEGMKVRAEADPEVNKALDLMPQARALADNARKVVAERNSAPPVTR